MECCSICGRPLDDKDDPLSPSCGGDCLGCMINVERESGYHTDLEIKMRDRIVFYEELLDGCN